MILRGGEIFLARKERGKVLDVQLITEDGDRQRILNACHSDPTSRHLGVKKTIKRIRERFTWKGLNKDVAKLVSTCDVCQRHNDKMVIKCDELHPVPLHSTWHHVAIDFIGPLPNSRSGNSYIDVKGTTQEAITKEVIDIAAKKLGVKHGDISFEDFWKRKSQLVHGKDGSLTV